MISLPYKPIPYLCQDLLKVILEALFVEVTDNRLICLNDPITLSKRVGIVRESSIITKLVDALEIFGEDDFINLISKKLIILTNEVSLGVDFNEAFNDNFRDII